MRDLVDWSRLRHTLTFKVPPRGYVVAERVLQRRIAGARGRLTRSQAIVQLLEEDDARATARTKANAKAGQPSPSAFGVPDLDVPDLDVPDLDVPDLDVPDLEVPDPDVPDPDVPDLEVPDPDVADLEVADLEVPDLEVPDLDVPDLEVPDLDVPDLEVPDLGVPDTTATATARPARRAHPAECTTSRVAAGRRGSAREATATGLPARARTGLLWLEVRLPGGDGGGGTPDRGEPRGEGTVIGFGRFARGLHMELRLRLPDGTEIVARRAA